MGSPDLLQIGMWLNDHLFGPQNARAAAVGYFIITFVAALATQLIFWDIDTSLIARRLGRLLPALQHHRTAPLFVLIAIVGLGALLGYAIYAPTDGRQATLAGIGWYTAVRSVKSKLGERRAAAQEETP